MTITLRAKSPEDLLAAIPVTLGFEPHDSVVMLTFGAATPFHARIDLPPRSDPEALAAVVSSLLAPCRRHRVRRVVFVLYGADPTGCRQVARRLRRDFERSGLEVVECLRADANRWYCADGRSPGVPDHGVPYDISGHPFRAQAVLAGQVMLGSREELAETLAPDDPAIAAVAAAVPDARMLTGSELAAVCRRHAECGTLPDDAELAAMLLTIRVGALRDAAWSWLCRDDAPRHVALWRDAVRRAPAELVPAAAAVLAFAAWLAGDGALAWCALDRCFQVDARHSLGEMVAQMVAGALPPSAWQTMREGLSDQASPTRAEHRSPGGASPAG
jgi:hypothetical protein